MADIYVEIKVNDTVFAIKKTTSGVKPSTVLADILIYAIEILGYDDRINITAEK